MRRSGTGPLAPRKHRRQKRRFPAPVLQRGSIRAEHSPDRIFLYAESVFFQNRCTLLHHQHPQSSANAVCQTEAQLRQTVPSQNQDPDSGKILLLCNLARRDVHAFEQLIQTPLRVKDSDRLPDRFIDVAVDFQNKRIHSGELPAPEIRLQRQRLSAEGGGNRNTLRDIPPLTCRNRNRSASLNGEFRNRKTPFERFLRPGIVEELNLLLDRFAGKEAGGAFGEVTFFPDNSSEQSRRLFGNGFSCFCELPGRGGILIGSLAGREEIGHDSGLFQIVQTFGIFLFPSASGTGPEALPVPEQVERDAARTEVRKILLQVQTPDRVGIAVAHQEVGELPEPDLPVSRAEPFLQIIELPFLLRIPVRLLPQERRIVLIIPDMHHIAGRVDETRTAIAGPVGHMRKTIFRQMQRFFPVFLPEFEPVAALLNRSPVRIQIDRIDRSEISRMVIDDPVGIYSGDDLFTQGRLFPVSGETGSGKNSGDPFRILRIGSPREIVIGHIEDDRRKILEFPDLERGIGRIAAGILRFGQIPVMRGMRQRKGGQNPLSGEFFIERSLISRFSGKEAVFEREEVIDSAFLCKLHCAADLCGGGLVRPGSGQIHAHAPEMNLLSIQQEIPSVEGELPEPEEFGEEAVDLLSVFRLQTQFQSVEIFRAVQIPELFRFPFLAEGDPLRAFFERHQRGGKRFDDLSMIGDDPVKPIPSAVRENDTGIQQELSLYHARHDAHVADLPVQRTVFQPEISENPPLFHISPNLHDPSRRHESLGAVLIRTGDEQQNEFMFFSRRHLSTQIQRSPRIIEFSAELPVEKAAGGGLNHFRIQQDSSICPVFRHAECPQIPSGIQLFIGDGPFPAGGIPDFLRLSGCPVRPCAGDLENAPAASGGRKGKLIRNLPVIHLQKLP